MSTHAEDHILAFREAMASHGIRYSGPIEADGKFHRVAGDDDSKGKKNVFYVLHIDDRPAGVFGSNKLYGNDKKFSWKAEGAKPLTPQERAALAEAAKAAAAKRAAEEKVRHEAARDFSGALWGEAVPASTHPYLTRKQIQSHDLRVGPWRKVRNDGSTYEVCRDALLIPMRDEKKVVWGLQAILPKAVTMGGVERDKDFVLGARKQGLWYSIGRPVEVGGQMTVLLGEGYATCASIYEATGIGILVCFDAGNLAHVAAKLRSMMPKVRIVICSDNDWFTVVAELPTNVGVEKALAAAKSVAGEVVTPSFEGMPSFAEARAMPDVERRGLPTDFNDLHKRSGLDEVRRQIMAHIDPQPAEAPVEAEPVAEDEPPPWSDAPEGPGEDDHHTDNLPATTDSGPPAEEKKKRKRKEEQQGDPDSIKDNSWFRILGHDRDNVYIFQKEMKMVLANKKDSWGRNSLLCLASQAWWQINFPGGGKEGFDTGMAANAMIRHAFDMGYYDPTATRGRGAWRDSGRIVFHFGGRLLVDNEEMDVTDIKSNYVYEQGRHLRMPPADPLSGADGAKIIKVAQAFHWTRPASAILLAGWVALAPLCGALRWRPHIWITGGTGSGKSTVLNEFVWFLMNGMEVYAQGNSTEAGIRQTLMTDALPVLFDESEQNNDRERLRVQQILALIRQASTESQAKTLKGTQIGMAQGFMIRSMFCLASVQVGMEHQSDQERISILSLRPKRTDSKEQASSNWAAIKGAVDSIKSDPELPGRMLRRAIQLMPVTLQNIEIFAKVAADMQFGSQREGDQFGAMLAGAWSLAKSTIVTEDEAKDMIRRYDWTEYTEASETEESTKALHTLMERMIKINGQDVTIYELLGRAARRDAGEGVWSGAEDLATALLLRHGIKIKWVTKHPRDAAVLFANTSSNLAELMADTPYASDVKGQLIRVPGAFKTDKAEKFNGLTSRAVGIPLLNILDGLSLEGVNPDDDEIPF